MFQGTGLTAEIELELHARLCGGVVVVKASEVKIWVDRLNGVAPVYSPYTFNEIELPTLVLVGSSLRSNQLLAIDRRVREAGGRCKVIDTRKWPRPVDE